MTVWSLTITVVKPDKLTDVTNELFFDEDIALNKFNNINNIFIESFKEDFNLFADNNIKFEDYLHNSLIYNVNNDLYKYLHYVFEDNGHEIIITLKQKTDKIMENNKIYVVVEHTRKDKFCENESIIKNVFKDKDTAISYAKEYSRNFMDNYDYIVEDKINFIYDCLLDNDPSNEAEYQDYMEISVLEHTLK